MKYTTPAIESPLHVLLQKEAQGTLSFARFMELALYHPQHGYYAGGKVRFGRKGDYFTSVSVGALYGQLIARQAVEVWERLGKQAWTWVEQGAGHGEFAFDALQWLRARYPQAYDSCTYIIVEPFEHFRLRQQENLNALAPRVQWVNTLEDLPAFEGFFFSNELIDSMPVHRVQFSKGAWWEMQVGWNGNEWAWILQPPSFEYPAWEALPSVEGWQAEINLHAMEWMRSVAQKLKRGAVVTVDYGYTEEELFSPEKREGSVRAFSKHRQSSELLANAGEQDITADVNFSRLMHVGEVEGLTQATFTDQHHFLVGIAEKFLAEEQSLTKELRSFRTLMHPEIMGTRFRVLAQQKHMPTAEPLMGLKFARKNLSYSHSI